MTDRFEARPKLEVYHVLNNPIICLTSGMGENRQLPPGWGVLKAALNKSNRFIILMTKSLVEHARIQ